MKPSLTFLVYSYNGDAAALAAVGCRRAAQLGLHADVIPLVAKDQLSAAQGRERITVLVPAEFAEARHQAWCLLCQLSLLRCGVGFTLLVLGAAGCGEFEARQSSLLTQPSTQPLFVARRLRHHAA